jgi:hypothetical protein
MGGEGNSDLTGQGRAKWCSVHPLEEAEKLTIHFFFFDKFPGRLTARLCGALGARAVLSPESPWAALHDSLPGSS